MAIKCDPRAYAKCPDRVKCGPWQDAIFTEGSECDEFNQKVINAPPTNGDRIRSMSDEELARVFSSACVGCVVKECKLHNYASYGCEKSFLKWLQQPAE